MCGLVVSQKLNAYTTKAAKRFRINWRKPARQQNICLEVGKNELSFFIWCVISSWNKFGVYRSHQPGYVQTLVSAL